jgi:hypothetical protein
MNIEDDLQTPDDVLLGANTFHAMAPFSYIGRGLTLFEFVEYVDTFNFGLYPPTSVVLHHTIMPDAGYAKLSKGVWTAGEARLKPDQVYAKRLKQLDSIRNYYRDTKGWSKGPHLFIDEKYIWLFTPMDEPGIHAKHGNGVYNNFSIGIEMIGYFEKLLWPSAVETLVGGAVAVLQNKLKTFDITYRTHNGISSHRDWGKPECPGKAITEKYYIEVLRREARRLFPLSSPPSPIYVAQANGLRIREQPNTTSVIKGMINYGYKVAVSEIVDGEKVIDTTKWGKVSNGYVSMRYMKPVE